MGGAGLPSGVIVGAVSSEIIAVTSVWSVCFLVERVRSSCRLVVRRSVGTAAGDNIMMIVVCSGLWLFFTE